MHVENRAATAGAAGVLAARFQELAEEAGKSRLYAGVEFPTDYFAGLELGRKVAARVIALACTDGSNAVWTRAAPTGKCMWQRNRDNMETIFAKRAR